MSKAMKEAIGFNPDSPTMDGSDPEIPAQETKPARPVCSVSPDGETVDEGAAAAQAAPAKSSPSVPFRANAAFRTDAPANAQPAEKSKPSLPFKPMGGGFTAQPQKSAPASPAAVPAGRVQSVSSAGYRTAAPQPGGMTPPAAEPQPDHRSLTLKEMENLENSRYNAELQQYNQAIKKWKSRIWIPFAMLIGVLLLCLLAGAFMGGIGIVFTLVIVSGAIAILTAMGKMSWLRIPKKPKKQLPQMDTPELTTVYSVRLRLKSMNLPKPVEVTIRKENQALGSDGTRCIQPLAYKGISHVHCTIISRDQHGHTEYYIRDERSTNGTRLNERKLDPGIEYPLQIGDVVTLAGRYQFRVLSDAY